MDIDQTGNGADIVVLHSLLTDRSAFRHILPGLQARRRVTLINLPGYGRTPPSRDRIEGVAEIIADRLPSAGVTSHFDLIGNGYGGFIAISLAQRWAERIRRLVLLDTAAYFPPEDKTPLIGLKAAVERGGMAAVVDAAIRRLFPQIFIQANPVIADECRKVLLALNPSDFAVTCQNLIDADLRPGLAKITNPTIVIVGSDDAATRPPLARVLADGIRGARLVELPGCGHAPHVQDPNSVIKILDSFLELRKDVSA